MASRSINKVTLLGNLTRDPELKYTPTGAPVCTFGVATNRSWTTAEGQTKEETQFHRITAWHKLAELCSKLLTKGRKIYLEGRLVYRSYTGKDGQQRSITEIIMDDFIVFSDSRRTAGTEEIPVETQSSESNNDSTEVEEPESKQQKGKTKKDETPTGSDRIGAGGKEETISPDDIPF